MTFHTTSFAALLGLALCGGAANAQESHYWRPEETRKIPWVERLTGRGAHSPCLWYSLAPVDATTTRIIDGTARKYEFQATERTDTPAPALLLDCCRPAHDVRLQPLLGVWTIERFDRDPPAARVTNPADWFTALFAPENAYQGEVLVEIAKTNRRDDTRSTHSWLRPITRRATSWSTETAYTIPMTGEEAVRLLEDGGEFALTLRTMPPVEGRGSISTRARFITAQATETFIEACRSTVNPAPKHDP